MSLHLEVFLRFSSVGILSIVCVFLLVQGLKPRIHVYALLLCFSVICALLSSGTYDWKLTGVIGICLHLVTNYILVFAWRFGMAVFDEDVNIGFFAYIVLSFFFIGPLLDVLIHQTSFSIGSFDLNILRQIYIVICFGLMVHLGYRTYIGYNNDLVENRRKNRRGFVAFVVIAMFFIILITEISRTAQELNLSTYLYLLAPIFSTVMAIWVFKLNTHTLINSDLSFTKPISTTHFAPAEQVQLDRLNNLMSLHEVYRENGLTVTLLAKQMTMPENQLRLLINKKLGYRNFSAFLNSYRIEDVKKQLSNPEKFKVPILTIALDAGFSSISPFNSAFKSATGMSPTTYRKTLETE